MVAERIDLRRVEQIVGIDDDEIDQVIIRKPFNGSIGPHVGQRLQQDAQTFYDRPLDPCSFVYARVLSSTERPVDYRGGDLSLHIPRKRRVRLECRRQADQSV